MPQLRRSPTSHASVGRQGSPAGSPKSPSQRTRSKLSRANTTPDGRRKLERLDSKISCESRKSYLVGELEEEDERALEHLRTALLQRFGRPDAAFAALDVHGHGLLKFKELESSLQEWFSDALAVTDGVDLKRVFSLLDIHESGKLSIHELMETTPWRAEDEAILILRGHILEKFGDRYHLKQSMMPFARENGCISLDQFRAWLHTNFRDTPMDKLTGGVALGRIFVILDTDFSEDVSVDELLDNDPRKEAHRRNDAINNLRRDLISFFGSPEAMVSKIDTNGNGLISYGELRMGLDRCRFDYRKALGSHDLFWVFKLMDVDGSGDLSVHELVEADTERERLEQERHRIHEAKQKRLANRKKRAKSRLHKEGKHDGDKEKDSGKADSMAIPDWDPVDFDSLSPALQKIVLFGVREPESPKATPKAPEMRPSKAYLFADVDSATLFPAPAPKVDDKRFDLSHCYIGQYGAMLLANALLDPATRAPLLRATALSDAWEPRFGKLQRLQLWANYIGPIAGCWIAAAAEGLPIKSLGLAWNHLDDRTAARLSSTIVTHKTLEELDVSFNRIGEGGGQNFVAALLKPSTKFTVLDLRFNNLDKPSVARLRGAATSHRKFTLRLKGNPGSNDMNENPIVTAQVVGGQVLPQISDLVVAGWPRTSTAIDDPRNMRMESAKSRRSVKSVDTWGSRSDTGRHGLPMATEPGGWPAATQLAKSLSEATLTAVGSRRMWSRQAVRRHAPLASDEAF